VGDGCHERTDAGLSRFGMELVAEMERVGMIVDCTHTGMRTTMDVMEVATKPVMFSHSNPRALCDHERNITDEQIRACAAGGGVIGVTGPANFLGQNDISPEMVFRHVDYIAKLVGHDHVGFGFDYVADVNVTRAIVRANPSKYPREKYDPDTIGFTPPEVMSQVTEQMLLHRYSEADVRSILGQNWLRIARECWKPRRHIISPRDNA
jgi:membrane dipeptidase